MIPQWLIFLGSIGPILLIISVLAICFGVYRFWNYTSTRTKERLEEERKREELLMKINQRIQSKRLKT